MICKKIGILLSVLFLVSFSNEPLSAEVIGNLEFEPPVSLKEWSNTESSDNEEGSSLRICSQTYVRNSDNFMEVLGLMNFISKDPSFFSKGFTEKLDIKNYLTNRHQKIVEKVSISEKGYSDMRVSVTDIIVDHSSLFYKVTTFHKEKIIGFSWHREIKEKGQWIKFFYIVGEKLPNDPNFPTEDVMNIAGSWIKFLRDDFSEKVIYLNE